MEGSFIVNSKYKFVEVLAARVAKQQPALPRLASGAGWMARQAKRTGRQVKVCRAAQRDNPPSGFHAQLQEGAKAALRPAKSSAGGSRGIWCQQEAPQKKKQGILASRVERPTLQDDIGRESPSRENRN